MLNLQGLNAQDLQGLSPSSLAEVAVQMLTHIGEQSKQIASQAQAIKFKDVKIERITFELSRLTDSPLIQPILIASGGSAIARSPRRSPASRACTCRTPG